MGFELAKVWNNSWLGLTDVVGLDLAATGVKAVRLKKNKQGVCIVSAGLLPRVVMPAATGEPPARVEPLILPPAFRAHYAALAVSSPAAVVKLLIMPGMVENFEQLSFRELLGLGDTPVYRIGAEVVAKADSKRQETNILAAALPECQAHWACKLLYQGRPAPRSVETAGLAALSCYMKGPGREEMGSSIVVDFGAETSMAGIFIDGQLALVRQFGIGVNAVVRQVQQSFGVDEETARGIVEDGSIDTSTATAAALDVFIRQLTVSRDFVERRQNTRITKLFACGGGAINKDWRLAIQSALGIAVETWNPLAMAPADAGVLEAVAGMEPRFAAAMGAALCVMETL